MVYRVLFPVVLLSCCLFHCADHKEAQISAAIEGDPISLESVDSLVHDKLYEHLFDVYSSRSIALNMLIAEKLLNKEAVNRKISVDSLLQLEVDTKATDAALSQLIADNSLEGGVRDPKNFNRLIDVRSAEGQEYLYGVLKRKLEREFITELKGKYRTEVFLKPPIPPRTNTKDVLKYPLSEAGKNIEVLWVSDFNCSACKTEYPLIKELIRKYSNRFSFYHVPFSNSVTRDMIYFECATQTLKEGGHIFSTMFESQKDSLDLKLISMALGADHSQISACMDRSAAQVTDKLESSFRVLIEKKIAQTPTIIIDDRIYYGPMDLESLSAYIETIVSAQ